MSNIIITDDDEEKTFTVGLGKLIKIQLSENPTTGYQWKIDSINHSVINFVASTFSQMPGTGIGGGGKKTFTFSTCSRGISKIALILRREWEPKTSAIDNFIVTVHVI